MLKSEENHYTGAETYHLCILHWELVCLCFHYKSDFSNIYNTAVKKKKVGPGLEFGICLNFLIFQFLFYPCFSNTMTSIPAFLEVYIIS